MRLKISLIVIAIILVFAHTFAFLVSMYIAMVASTIESTSCMCLLRLPSAFLFFMAVHATEVTGPIELVLVLELLTFGMGVQGLFVAVIAILLFKLHFFICQTVYDVIVVFCLS